MSKAPCKYARNGEKPTSVVFQVFNNMHHVTKTEENIEKKTFSIRIKRRKHLTFE